MRPTALSRRFAARTKRSNALIVRTSSSSLGSFDAGIDEQRENHHRGERRDETDLLAAHLDLEPRILLLRGAIERAGQAEVNEQERMRVEREKEDAYEDSAKGRDHRERVRLETRVEPSRLGRRDDVRNLHGDVNEHPPDDEPRITELGCREQV